MKLVARNSRDGILRKSQGAITIFEMLPLIALIGGVCIGVKLGSQFGHAGALLGGILGAAAGLLCWWLGLKALCKWLDRKYTLNTRSVDDLRELLHNPKCKNPNEVLLALGMKGEKMDNYLPVILQLLMSPSIEGRKRGWQALVSIFPAQAKIITDYHYGDTVEKCREKVQKLIPVQI